VKFRPGAASVELQYPARHNNTVQYTRAVILSTCNHNELCKKENALLSEFARRGGEITGSIREVFTDDETTIKTSADIKK